MIGAYADMIWRAQSKWCPATVQIIKSGQTAEFACFFLFVVRESAVAGVRRIA